MEVFGANATDDDNILTDPFTEVEEDADAVFLYGVISMLLSYGSILGFLLSNDYYWVAV